MRTERLLLAIFGGCVALAASGCAIIGGIFKAGAVTGIVGVVLLAAVVVLLITRFTGGRS